MFIFRKKRIDEVPREADDERGANSRGNKCSGRSMKAKLAGLLGSFDKMYDMPLTYQHTPTNRQTGHRKASLPIIRQLP